MPTNSTITIEQQQYNQPLAYKNSIKKNNKDNDKNVCWKWKEMLLLMSIFNYSNSHKVSIQQCSKMPADMKCLEELESNCLTFVAVYMLLLLLLWLLLVLRVLLYF